MIKTFANLERHWMVLLLLVTPAPAVCQRLPALRSAAHMEAGKRLLRKNETARVLLQFQNALELAPKTSDAYYRPQAIQIIRVSHGSGPEVTGVR